MISDPMPSNITECKSALNGTSVVLCTDPSWETIHSDQIPPSVNYLLVANTNVTTISHDAFSSKAIMILHMTYNPLEKIDPEGMVKNKFSNFDNQRQIRIYFCFNL